MGTLQRNEPGYSGVSWGLRAIRWGLLGTFTVWLLSIAFVMVAMGTGWDLSRVFKASVLSDLCLAIYGLGMLAQFTSPAEGPSKAALTLHLLTLLAQRALWHAATFATLKLAGVISLVLALVNVLTFFRHFSGLAEFFDRRSAQADFQFAFLSLLRTGSILLVGGLGIILCLPFSLGSIVWILLLTTVLSCVYGIPGLLRFCDGLDFLSVHLYRHQADILLPTASALNYQKETPVTPKAEEAPAGPLGNARSLLRRRQLPEAEKYARIAVDESRGAQRREAVRLLASILKEQERYQESADLLKEFETPRPAPAKATPQLPEPESYLHVVTLPGIGQVGFQDLGFTREGRLWRDGKWQNSSFLPGGASASFVVQQSRR